MRVGAPDQVQPGEEEAEEPMNSNKKVIKLLFASEEELLKKTVTLFLKQVVSRDFKKYL